MPYPKRRRTESLSVPQSESDDVNVKAVCVVPAGNLIEIYALESWVRTGSGASDTIEVVDSDDDTTPLAEVDTNTAGANKSSASFPITVRNSGTADKAVLFRTNGATDAGTEVEVFCTFSDPGPA